MRHGIDTGFLVAAAVAEHPDQTSARLKLAELLVAGDRFALAPQVLAEFIHIVTDPRRFVQPLDMASARDLAEQWWTARDVDPVFPGEAAVRQFLDWLRQHHLGRIRSRQENHDGQTNPSSPRPAWTHRVQLVSGGATGG